MSLSDSSKRAVRTLVHAVLGGLIAASTFLPSLVSALAHSPWGGQAVVIAAAVAAVIALVAAVLNKLEDLGIIPTWLRSDVSVFESTPGVAGGPDVSTAAENIQNAVRDIKAAYNKPPTTPPSL